jgi:autotransporter-associated beta strand protein
MKPASTKHGIFPLLTSLLAVLTLFAQAQFGLRAATITWGPATIIAATNDVSTAGTSKYAYDWAGNPGSLTLNGVPFTGITNAVGSTADGNLAISGFGSRNTNAFTTTSTPFGSLPTAYKPALQGGAFNNDGSPATVTLSNLIAGANYSVQVWIGDPRGGSATVGTNRIQTVTSGANSVVLTNNVTHTTGGLGQYAIGTFTADATTQAFTISGGLIVSGSGTASSQINALQVRDITGVPVATPAFSPVAGTYVGAQTVTMTSEIGSTVFYTIDGSTPNNTSPRGAVGSGSAIVSISAPATVTIQAYATNNAKLDSAVASAVYTTVAGTVGTWVHAAGGSWANAANWMNSAIPSGTNLTADFSTLNLGGDVVVSLDGAQTIGRLWFDDQNATKHAWALSAGTAGPLTLAATNGAPIISNNVQTTILVPIAGTQGLTKTGNGILILTNNNAAAFSGSVIVSAGTLRLSQATVVANSSTFVLGDAYSGSGIVTFQVAPGTGAIQPITVSSNASAAKLVLDYNPQAITLGLVRGPITLQHDLWITNSSTQVLEIDSQVTGSNKDLHVDTGSFGTRARLNFNGNNFGNLYIHSGGLQTGDGTPGTLNAIPDGADVTIYAGGALGIGKQDTFGALNGDIGAILGENVAPDGTSIAITIGNNNHDGVFNGDIFCADVGSGARTNENLQITKLGTGTQTFNGACSNTAPTRVGGGTLVINSSYFASAVIVSNSATLGGSGALSSNVTVLAGGVLAPGASIGTLSIGNDLTLAGDLYIEVDKQNPLTNDFLVVGGLLTNAGTGLVTLTNRNSGPAFAYAAGDRFTLLSKALANGGALNIAFVPPLAPGLTWTNKLDVDGSIGILATVATNPTNITVSVSGGNLNLSWPADHLGWRLETQTNPRNIGLSNDWTTVPGSTSVTSTNFPINPANPTVFYRLVYP